MDNQDSGGFSQLKNEMRLSSDEKELLNVVFCLMSLLEAITASMNYMVLLDVIKKGHSEPNKKIGSEVNAFEIHHHPTFQSRCLFVIRDDQ
ncbi:hypothetical protein KSS87_003655 [Heliosperma pusillum]|nr:hypothetical protein KSS87_003655 [Heliosperma pusillum]